MKPFSVYDPRHNMKKDIHPTYYEKAEVICACGNKFTVGATRPKLEVEICSNCHPFFTGKEKLVDTSGRVERYKERAAKTATMKKTKALRDASKDRGAKKPAHRPK